LSDILLTQNHTFLFKYVVWLLGEIMNGIFNVLNMIGIPNIGISIILFTIVMYMLMTPLTIKQQKFSKLSAKMNPELQAIRAKYAGKKDNVSMTAMNQETQAVYSKYGVSPTGSCLQLLIQMPVLLALYKVIYSMPAYVGKVKEAFFPLVNNFKDTDVSFFKENFSSYQYYAKQFADTTTYDIKNSFIDVLNRASTEDWAKLKDAYPNFSSDITNTLSQLKHYNNFLGLNIGDSPSVIIHESINSGSWLLVIGAILIPLLSALTQFISVKLMPQMPQTNNGEPNPMASSMKTMNMIMPIMSAFFCYTLPAGMGIYWIAGAIVRTIQQIMINKHIDKMNLDEIIKVNVEKNNKKREKLGLPPQQLKTNAAISTKTVSASASKVQKTQEAKDKEVKDATNYYKGNAKPGSIAAKANMVKQYNENNNNRG